MAFEYRFNAITFYPKNEPLRFAPPETSEPSRFKNSSGWFCGLYVGCLFFKSIFFFVNSLIVIHTLCHSNVFKMRAICDGVAQ